MQYDIKIQNFRFTHFNKKCLPVIGQDDKHVEDTEIRRLNLYMDSSNKRVSQETKKLNVAEKVGRIGPLTKQTKHMWKGRG